jgi:zinc ribbon protein
MYCDRCGATLPEGAAFCPACGKNLGTTASPVARSRLARHLPVVSVLWMVVSALWLIAGIWVIAVGSWFLPMMVTSWPLERLIPGLVSAVGVGLLVIGGLGVAAGWGLMQREPWARVVAIILAFIALFHFALGTALGIYTLWVLLPSGAAEEYRRAAPA